MAVAPKFAGLIAPFANATAPSHTIELWLDYVCPFSKKMFVTVYEQVAPLLKSEHKGKVSVIFRPIVQSWHPSSTLCHEAAVAVLQTQPERFWDFSSALFAKQTEFFDVNTVNETRNQTYKRLAKIAGQSGLDEGKIYGKLEVADKPAENGSLNTGNATTNDLKLLIRAQRLNDFSSSWDKDQWVKWLKDNTT